jgi:hypothetical protein
LRDFPPLGDGGRASFAIAALAIFAARALATIRRAAEQSAAEAAKAASIAADEFVTTHRPRIHLRRVYQVLVQAPHAQALLQFVNRGETDAHIVEIGVDLFPRNRATDAMVNYHALPRRHARIIPPGKDAVMNVYGVSNLTQADVDAITAGDVQLCLLAIVNYTDSKGLLRSVSAFRAFDTGQRRFLRVAENDEFAEWDYED